MFDDLILYWNIIPYILRIQNWFYLNADLPYYVGILYAETTQAASFQECFLPSGMIRVVKIIRNYRHDLS